MSTFRTGSVLNQRNVCKEMQKRMAKFEFNRKTIIKIQNFISHPSNRNLGICIYGVYEPTKDQIYVLEQLIYKFDVCVHIKSRRYEKFGKKYYKVIIHQRRCTFSKEIIYETMTKYNEMPVLTPMYGINRELRNGVIIQQNRPRYENFEEYLDQLKTLSPPRRGSN